MTPSDAPRPSRRVGLLLAVAVALLALLSRGVLAPWHRAGVAQPVISPLLGLDHLLQLPGTGTAMLVGLRQQHQPTTAGWIVGLLLNLPLYYLVGLGLARFWRGRPRPADAPPRPDRRRFLRASLGAGSAALGAYSLALEPRSVRVTHTAVPIRGLPEALRGLRLVQLTDIHHGPWVPLDYVHEVVRLANALGPDVVLLTGDYVHRSEDYIAPVVDALAALTPRIGTVAVLGNHDWYHDPDRTRRLLRETGAVLLDNDRRILTPDGLLVDRHTAGLAVCGVGDYWEDVPDYRAALDGLPDALPRLLLAHNPDTAEADELRAGGLRVDLVTCGHTHGGQVRLPFLGTPMIPSRYGRKYAAGLVRGPQCPVYVSCGVGVSMLPVRLGVPPEVAVLELYPLPELAAPPSS